MPPKAPASPASPKTPKTPGPAPKTPGQTSVGGTFQVARAAARFQGQAAAREAHEAADAEFLDGVDADSRQEDVSRAVTLLQAAGQAGRAKIVEAGSEAVERVCATSDGYKTLLSAGGMEALLTAVQLAPEQGVAAAWRACCAFCRQTVAWLDELDEVDFTELGNLLNIARLLGCFDEDVAVASLGAIERFVQYSRSHTAAMLQNGILQTMHMMIGAHRNPELVQEAFAVLFRICDLPPEAVVEPLVDECGLVATVVEAMNQAPLNLRMNLAGLRLLCLWARLDEKRVNSAIAKANAQAVVKRAVADLSQSGLTHASSWVSAVAGRMLSGATKSAS